MTLNEAIQKIATDCLTLKDKYVQEKELKVDWVCVFSQNDEEYKNYNTEAQKIGELIETTESGLIYKLTKPIQTVAGNPKILKIRKYDPTKPEMGDIDFTTIYEEFKNKYLDNNVFTLIKREKFEMIELKDKDFNVRVYFSSIPPSKLRGIN